MIKDDKGDKLGESIMQKEIAKHIPHDKKLTDIKPEILLRHETKEIFPNITIKKIRACSYYSPFRNMCVHPDHSEYDDCYPTRHPRCNYRGKYSDCRLVDKVIELTLDENNTIIDREYIYIKDWVDRSNKSKEIEDDKKGEQDCGRVGS